jgi:signal transduction histidine kinase
MIATAADLMRDPQAESELAVTRVRTGLWALLGGTLALSASELFLQSARLPLGEALKWMVLLAVALGFLALRYRPSRSTAFAVAQIAIAAAALTNARTGIATGRVPTGIYIAIIVFAAANTPWGASGQLLANLITGAAYGWNLWGLAPAGQALTSRDFIGFLTIGGVTVYFAHVFEHHQRLQFSNQRLEALREQEREQHLRELEARVEARTTALTDTNARLQQEIRGRRITQEMLELLMDSVPPSIAYVGADLRYRWVNRRYSEWWQPPVPSLVGRALSEVHHGGAWAVVQDHLPAVLGGHSPTFDVTIPTPAGAPRALEITLLPHPQPDGAIGGFFVFAYDMTDRFAREETSHRTERLAALGTLAAGIAHEINNPAASILATADLARAALADGDLSLVDESLSGIGGEAARCGQIVRSVLHFAREDPSARQPQALADIVGRATDLLRSQVSRAGAAVRTDVPMALPPLPMNGSEIIQVLVNLVTNALRAQATEVAIVAEPDDELVRLRVSDNGNGMTETERQRAFDPFFTTGRHSGGTGLGLSITHAIIMAHGGRIDVQSAPGSGTTFTITLPTIEVPSPSRGRREHDLSNA